jgi:hypothetical protein
VQTVLPVLLISLATSPAWAGKPSPVQVLSYLITGNLPGHETAFPSAGGKDEIEYTNAGFIYHGEDRLEFAIDATDPCHPAVRLAGTTATENRLTIDMSRFQSAFSLFGNEAPALMMFSGEQCAVHAENGDHREQSCGTVYGSGNVFNFHMSLIKATPIKDFDRFDAKLRNERLRLAGEFYKVEYCRPEPSF